MQDHVGSRMLAGGPEPSASSFPESQRWSVPGGAPERSPPGSEGCELCKRWGPGSCASFAGDGPSATRRRSSSPWINVSSPVERTEWVGEVREERQSRPEVAATGRSGAHASPVELARVLVASTVAAAAGADGWTRTLMPAATSPPPGSLREGTEQVGDDPLDPASAQESEGTAGDVGGVPDDNGGIRDEGSVEPHGEDDPPSCEWVASVVEQVDGAESPSRADGESPLRSATQMELRWGRMAVLSLCRGRREAVLAASRKRLAQEARRRQSRRPTLDDRWERF